MNEKNALLIESAFKEYYFNRFDLIHVPQKATEREFGYQKFNSGMTRHLVVKNDKELHLLLMKEVPSDVYCSNAYYSFPSLSMSEKDWKGADLIFDIDAKDLALPCRKDHTVFKCISCNEATAEFQQQCKCGSAKFETVSVSCKNCISESKKEVTKLVDILTTDLNVQKEQIEVYFSGNEGFHLRVTNSDYEQLGSQERADLVDYIMFNGAIPESFGIKRQNNFKASLPTFDEKGWRGRVARKLFSSKSKAPKVTREIITNGYSAFQVQLEEIKKTMGVRVDPKVTMDIHRIFRLEGSINSKSGLSKIQCINLDSFDPYLEACLLGDDDVSILVNCPLQVRLKNKKFGPHHNEIVSLPKYAAVYMLCKGLGNAV
ncbi:MAG TPA: DNA primase small subunit domain-containing protein [Candidatus Nitrosotalea sp.]|nr:DNA primase small subunit domain-containing protein [Candidatus Nitrosotalea sp.]